LLSCTGAESPEVNVLIVSDGSPLTSVAVKPSQGYLVWVKLNLDVKHSLQARFAGSGSCRADASDVITVKSSTAPMLDEPAVTSFTQLIPLLPLETVHNTLRDVFQERSTSSASVMPDEDECLPGDSTQDMPPHSDDIMFPKHQEER
jgi:hypothetical protein